MNCGNSLGNRAYANGAPTYPTERSTTQLMCNSGYVWTTGEPGTSLKTATCNDIGNGYGSWITNGDCIGELTFNLCKIVFAEELHRIRVKIGTDYRVGRVAADA